MSNGHGPWHGEREPPLPPKAPRGGLVWLAIVVVLAAGALLLFKAFPGAIQSPGDWAWLVGGKSVV